jgi:hypothetical protein
MLQDGMNPSIKEKGKPASKFGNLGTRMPEMMLLFF